MVMKKTGKKHLLRTIRKNGVSFLAVAFIAATSIAIFLGFQSTGNAILQETDRYFENNRLETLEISCANGITQEDIEEISKWDGVDAVEGGYSAMVAMDSEKEMITLQALTLLDEMNEPVVVEGTLPGAPDEAAVEENFALKEGIQVGDEIKLSHEGELTGDTFHVTAVINEPMFCCSKVKDARGKSTAGLGAASYYIALTKDAFDSSYFEDCFAKAFVRNNALDDFYFYSDAYEKEEAAFKEKIQELGAERAQLRCQSLKDDAQEALDEADGELADARKELADAEEEIESKKTELADAEEEIESKKTELADAEEEIESKKTELADAEQEIESRKTELADAKQEIQSKKGELADAEKEIESRKAELAEALGQIEGQLQGLGLTTDLDAAERQLAAFGEGGAPLVAAIQEYRAGEEQIAAAQAEISGAKIQLADAEAEAADAEVQISDAEAEVADGKEKLADAEKEVADGKVELADAEKEVADGKAELADAEKEVADAKEELADSETEFADAEDEAAEISLKDWVVAGRNEIGDVRGVEMTVDGIFGLSISMSVIFLVVAILVCHAAITRMINEQRVLIGAQKALGFRSGEILKHYMLYNTLSGLLGVFIGYVASVVIVEILVLHIYSTHFWLGSIPLSFAYREALVSAGICMVVFWGATYAACAKLVKQPATTLLRGEVPVRGKKYFFENWKAYKRMNLYSRTMIKNVLSDKGRMMNTIVGVVGCIGLLLICFSLKFAIADSSAWQYDKYFHYDNRLVFDSSRGSAEKFQEVLDEEKIEYTRIQDKLENFRVNGGNWENGRNAAVEDAEKIKDFMVLEDIRTKEILEVPEDGLLVSRRCAEEYDLSAGSTVEFMDSEGAAREFRIAGVMEHYNPYHLFVTSAGYFEETMGEEQDACVFLLKGNVDGLFEKVRNIDGFISLKDNSEFDSEEESKSIDPVIGICLLLSAVLSLLVLLNQIVMHINRKARELAVMRINGYTLSATRAYVYKDNIVLTVLGLLLGCVVGVGLSYFVIRAVETGALHYVRTPNIPACLGSCAVCGFFALIVNLIALRKVKHLNLTNVSGN